MRVERRVAASVPHDLEERGKVARADAERQFPRAKRIEVGMYSNRWYANVWEGDPPVGKFRWLETDA